MESSTRLLTRSASCPDCGGQVHLIGRVLIGEVFGCGQCSAQLEVASTEPVVLEPLAKVDEEEFAD